MPIIDLTHPIHPGMPVYPGDEQPTIAPSATIKHDGYLAHRLTLTTHTGTHLDAPAHLIPGGRTLDQFPVSHFQGAARVVDCRTVTGEILVSHLEPLALLQQTEFILILTGWDRFWGQARYFNGYPLLSLEAAAWLAQLPIKGIGVDTPSIDPPDTVHLPRHHAFLDRDRLIIENLAHLDAIPGRVCQLTCLPLAVTAGDGAPARVIAAVEG